MFSRALISSCINQTNPQKASDCVFNTHQVSRPTADSVPAFPCTPLCTSGAGKRRRKRRMKTIRRLIVEMLLNRPAVAVVKVPFVTRYKLYNTTHVHHLCSLVPFPLVEPNDNGLLSNKGCVT